MTLVPIDHISDGVSKVVTQYRDKPKFLTYLAVFLDQVQKLEDQTAAVENAFKLDTATGFRLDWIGRKVGQPRVGSTDEVYRMFIRGRIAANRSRGRIVDVERVAALLLQDWTYEQYMSTIVVYSNDDLTTETRQAIWGLLQTAAPAGTLVYFYCAPGVLGATWGAETIPNTGSFTVTTNTDGSPGGPGAVFAAVATLE